MHDDHLSAYDLELIFLRNDVQSAPVVPVHQDGSDIVHAGHRPFRSGRRRLYVVHADEPDPRSRLIPVFDSLKSKFIGKDKYGNSWNVEITSDGKQNWVRYKYNVINEGGQNKTPRPWDPSTGLNKNPFKKGGNWNMAQTKSNAQKHEPSFYQLDRSLDILHLQSEDWNIQ